MMGVQKSTFKVAIKKFCSVLLLLSFFQGTAYSAHAPTNGPSSSAAIKTHAPCKSCCEGEITWATWSELRFGDTAGQPIQLFDGRETHQEVDIRLGGSFDFAVTRKYDSRSDYDSSAGYGWVFTFDRALYSYSDGSKVIRSKCGLRSVFKPVGVLAGGRSAFDTVPGGLRGKLFLTAAGIYEFHYSGGGVDYYDSLGRIIAQVKSSGDRMEYYYDSNVKKSVIGVLNHSPTPGTPTETAKLYRISRIQERSADGSNTGVGITLTYNSNTGRIASIASDDGRVINYYFDETNGLTKGNLIKVVGLNNLTSTYKYEDSNDLHNLTYFQVGLDSTPYEVTYDIKDHAISQKHGFNKIDITYNDDFTVKVDETITDEQGLNAKVITKNYQFQIDGYLSSYTDDSGTKVVFGTDEGTGKRNSQQILQKLGANYVLLNSGSTSYDSQGRPLSEVKNLSSGEIITKTLTYDHSRIKSEQIVSSFEPDKIFRNEYTYYYNETGIPTNVKERKRLKEDDSYEITKFYYNSANKLVQTSLPDGHEIHYEYVESDKISKIYHKTKSGQILPQATAQFAYDNLGYRNWIKDAEGNVTNIVNDNRGNVIKIVNSLNEESNMGYDKKGNLKFIALGQLNQNKPTTWLQYNGRNLISSVGRDFNGDTLPFAGLDYDSNGRIIKKNDANGNATKYEYDNRGNVVAVTDQDLLTTRYEYDASDRLVISEDALNRKTKLIYDEMDRVIRIEKLGITPIQVSTYTYDAVGNVTSVTDPENNITRYEYNRLRQLVKISQPMQQSVSYTYDQRSRPETYVTAKGNKIKYSYEPWGPVKTIQYFETAVASQPIQTIGFSYDNNGNILTISDDSVMIGSMYIYTYDALNRVKTVTAKYIPDGDKILTYDYDQFGNRKTMHIQDGELLSHSYVYDDFNRLETASLPGNQSFSFSYFNNDQLKQVTWPNGLTSDYLYKPNGPVESIKVNDGVSSVLSQLSYVYDNVLNVDALTDNGATHDYGYDNVNRLVTATHPSGINLPLTEGFTYDDVGNREDPNNDNIYNYDANNRMLSSAIGSYTYDNNGNLKSRSDGASFSYNAINRLITFTKAATDANYKYDPFGRRINKTVNGKTTWFLWDGNLLLSEYDATGTRTKRYAYLNGVSSVAPVQYEQNNTVYNVHFDHLHTPNYLTNAAKAIVWQANYEVFGKAFVNEDVDGDLTNVNFNVRFPGQYFDGESGLHYNYFRYYDPEVGRYVSSDPIGLVGGLNTYGYVGGNPTNAIDPNGLMCRSTNGITLCIPDNNSFGSFSFSTPPGWRDFRSSNITYHAYEFFNDVGKGCESYEDLLIRELLMSPTNDVNPATKGGGINNVGPLHPFPGIDNVKSYIANDGASIVNITEDNHTVGSGFVMRKIVPYGDGRFGIHTYGEGNSWKQIMPFADGMAGEFWTKNANKIAGRAAGQNCQCK